MRNWSEPEVKKSVLVHAAKNRDGKMSDERKEYYSLLKRYARILAPFYDAVFGFLSLGTESKLRDRVVNFANVGNESRVLDVATGTGGQAFAFAKGNHDIVGIDLSEDMLRVAKRKNKYENVRFEIADATTLSFEDNSFDVSCVSFALHDMIPTIREKALSEMARVTKQNGTIVIVDYALPKNRISRFFVYHIVKLYEPYYSEFIESSLEALLGRSGIEIKGELSILHGAGRVIKGTPKTAVSRTREESGLAPQHKFKDPACIPAFNRKFLTPFYDFMMKYAARESTFKPRLVDQARIDAKQRVLDLGCGTATLTILIKKANPQAEVIGLDADPRILEIAEAKIAQAGLDIRLDEGMADQLPYPDGSFDHVFSSMVFHHLALEDKIHSLKEIIRVLKPGGELHIADLGKPHNSFMRLPTLIIRRLEEAEDNVKGLLPRLLSGAGLKHVEETTKYMTLVGTITLYKAKKPVTSNDEGGI